MAKAKGKTTRRRKTGTRPGTVRATIIRTRKRGSKKRTKRAPDTRRVVRAGAKSALARPARRRRPASHDVRERATAAPKAGRAPAMSLRDLLSGGIRSPKAPRVPEASVTSARVHRRMRSAYGLRSGSTLVQAQEPRAWRGTLNKPHIRKR